MRNAGGEIEARSPRRAALHRRGNDGFNLHLLARLQLQLPMRGVVAKHGRRGIHLHGGLAHGAVEAAVAEGGNVVFQDGPEVLPVHRPGHAAHLEHVNKIGRVADFNHELDGLQVEIFKRHAVEKHVVGQQLLAAYVNGVFRQVKRFAQRDVAGGQLDLRCEGFFRAGREHDGAMAADAQLKVAEEARVIVEEADVGSAGRHDVAGDGGGEKRLAVDEREVVDLARFQRLERNARFHVGRRNFHQFIVRDGLAKCAHAIARLVLPRFAPACRLMASRYTSMYWPTMPWTLKWLSTYWRTRSAGRASEAARCAISPMSR